MAGKIGIAGASVYVASKHAVEGLTKSAALEGAAAGVRVTALPGPDRLNSVFDPVLLAPTMAELLPTPNT